MGGGRKGKGTNTHFSTTLCGVGGWGGVFFLFVGVGLLFCLVGCVWGVWVGGGFVGAFPLRKTAFYCRLREKK